MEYRIRMEDRDSIGETGGFGFNLCVVPLPRIRVSLIWTSRGDRGKLYFCKGKQQLQVGEVGTNWKELYTTGLRVISEWCSTENVKDDSQSHKE